MSFYWTSIQAIMVLFLLEGCRISESSKDQKTNSSTETFFTDITDDVKLSFVHDAGVDSSYFMPESIGSGGAFLDYNNDGYRDIYLVNGSRHEEKNLDDELLKNRLFRQERDGTFVDVTETSGLGDTGYGMGVAVGDIDNDGDVDIYVTNYGPDALYQNDGNGTFREISKAAGISNPHWGCSVIFLDYNLDSYLDIYVTNYIVFDTTVVCTDRGGRPDYCGPAGFPGVADVLYRNNANGTFTNVSIESGIAKVASKGLGVVSADFDGDLYPDIYVANDGEPNNLWINHHDGTFQDQALVLGAAVNELERAEASMGIALADIDNDTDWDLFITHLRGESNTLYRNAADFGFLDRTSPLGLAGPACPIQGLALVLLITIMMGTSILL